MVDIVISFCVIYKVASISVAGQSLPRRYLSDFDIVLLFKIKIFLSLSEVAKLLFLFI